MIFTIILFLLGFVLITKGADIFIESTISVAKKTNIPEIVLGATIVSLATTFPELTVSAFASIQGHTTMSLGNAIGSIICNTGLALGLVAMIKPFKVDKKIFNSKAILLIISVTVLIILGMDKTIGRMDAMALIGLLVIYMINNYNSIPKTGSRRTSNVTNIEYSKSSDMIKLVVMFVIGITMMIIGSRLLVNNGIKIAEVFRSTTSCYKFNCNSTWNIAS